MHKKPISTAVIILGLAGCSDLTSTQQRTMTGGLGGAAGGAVIGAMAGRRWLSVRPAQTERTTGLQSRRADWA
jgi:hypothetical protein